MDSKIKAIFITIVSLLGATVLLIVFALNKGQNTMQKPTSETDSLNKESVSDVVSYEQGAVSGSIYELYELDPNKNPYAFLEDDSFFEVPKKEIDQTKVLSLQVSSVQKDLRIHVVDGYGQLVKDSEIEIAIQSLDRSDTEDDVASRRKTVRDEDGDGMLYISDLAAGEYSLHLKPVQGYDVPAEDLIAKVNDEISYTVLSDISFLIRSEDEIDAKEEDTAVNEAEADADGTETNVRLADGASVFGIDVSKWNKEIDWKKAKAAGVEFAIIRCGYRGSKTGALVEDPLFKANIQGALDADVRVGVYFFTQAITPMEAVEEASMVLTLCRKYKMSYPMFIDTEGAGGNGRADQLDKETRTQVCKAFCETIENAGFTGGVYASKSWLNNNLDMSVLSSYETWLAQYSRQATYEGEYDMWQYTSAGKIDGISTLVDFDVSYRDF